MTTKKKQECFSKQFNSLRRETDYIIYVKYLPLKLRFCNPVILYLDCKYCILLILSAVTQLFQLIMQYAYIMLKVADVFGV